MQDIVRPEKDTKQATSSPFLEKRCRHKRRKEPSRGYICISMVGWICRRERFRRKDDPRQLQ